MENSISGVEREEQDAPLEARCPICGTINSPLNHCRHVRWTFDQGDPIEFARFAVEMSPYVRARGHSAKEIPSDWWLVHGDWIVERVLAQFDAIAGFVFGELGQLDVLAMEVWKDFQPDSTQAEMVRY